LEKRRASSKSASDSKEIIAEAKRLAASYAKLDKEKQALADTWKTVKFMKNIHSIDDLRDYMEKSDYTVDEWGIATMERLLNIKMIVLSSEMFKHGDVDSVLQCGELSEHAVEQQANYKPEFYILTSLSEHKYTLITYKQKKLLKFSEIPYSIKVLIINKCMERNSGSFYLIKDFRDLKTRLGLDPNQGSREAEADEEEIGTGLSDLYEKDVVFAFYKGASDAQKPGKNNALGEQIPRNRTSEFIALQTISDWRKKLDDAWICPFQVDRHRWNSVTHYVLGSQFKKGFPDYYLQFSVDSGSDISQDLDAAKAACNNRVLREKKITVDKDFHEVGRNQRSLIERATALEAKFTQNLDLKQVLTETKRAKLVHFRRGSDGEPDEQLMKLRQQL
jgi:predicted NAD-dependent protein-ADP-ribosyltransferase YbiA (DUF1768 family)